MVVLRYMACGPWVSTHMHSPQQVLNCCQEKGMITSQSLLWAVHRHAEMHFHALSPENPNWLPEQRNGNQSGFEG